MLDYEAIQYSCRRPAEASSSQDPVCWGRRALSRSVCCLLSSPPPVETGMSASPRTTKERQSDASRARPSEPATRGKDVAQLRVARCILARYLARLYDQRFPAQVQVPVGWIVVIVYPEWIGLNAKHLYQRPPWPHGFCAQMFTCYCIRSREMYKLCAWLDSMRHGPLDIAQSRSRTDDSVHRRPPYTVFHVRTVPASVHCLLSSLHTPFYFWA